MTTFELYFCATVLRGAFAVLFLLAVESLLRHRLGAGFRRLLWLGCLVLMLVPQMNFSASPFRLDLSPLGMRAPAARSVADAVKNTGGQGRRDLISRAARNGLDVRALWHQVQSHRKALELGALLLLPLPALLLLLGRYVRCRRTIRPLPPVTDRRVLDAWNRVLADCGPLPRPVILLDSSRPDLGPTLFGCFTRKLLLPVDAFRELSDGELRLLLEHEYHHSRAGDPFLNIVALTLWALAWYNPFLLIARRRLRACCELECDRKILARHPHAVREYGQLLLRFASPSAPTVLPVAIGLAESPRELSGRIRSMTAAVRDRGGRVPGKGMAVLIALTLAAPIGLVAVNAKPLSRPRPAAVNAPAVPEKPVLPHLVLKPLPPPAGEEELVQAWEVFYPERFPFEKSDLVLEIGEFRLGMELDRKPGFLLLKKSDNPEAPYRLESALAAPPAGEEAAKSVAAVRVIPAADRKAVYATLSRAGKTAAFLLRVDGIGPEELANYRAVPAYR